MDNGTMGTGLHFDLARAAVKDDGKAIRKLLAKGANPLAQCKEGDTALMFAASKGCLEAVKALARVSDVDARNCNGQTALIVAAAGGLRNKPDVVREIIETIMEKSSDASIRARDHFGMNALMHAASECCFDACEVLLKKIDPISKDLKGRTALMHATQYGSDELIDLFFPISNVFAKDINGLSARGYAKKFRSDRLEEKFIEIERVISEREALSSELGIGKGRKAKVKSI